MTIKESDMEIFFSKKFKKCLKDNKYDVIYLIRGMNHSIFCLNKNQWREARRKIERMESPTPLAKDWNDYFETKGQDLKGMGYRSIHVPAHLQDWAKISKNVVMVYWPQKRIEIFAQELYPGMVEFEGVARL